MNNREGYSTGTVLVHSPKNVDRPWAVSKFSPATTYPTTPFIELHYNFRMCKRKKKVLEGWKTRRSELI